MLRRRRRLLTRSPLSSVVNTLRRYFLSLGKGLGPWPRTVNAHQISIDEVCANMADFLPTRSVLKVCLPVCLLNSGEVEQLRRSKEIDRCLSREKTYVKRLVKILLLGAGESGKSTFLKQMRIIHGQDFDQQAREEFRATIYSNIIKGNRWWERRGQVVLMATRRGFFLYINYYYFRLLSRADGGESFHICPSGAAGQDSHKHSVGTPMLARVSQPRLPLYGGGAAVNL